MKRYHIVKRDLLTPGRRIVFYLLAIVAALLLGALLSFALGILCLANPIYIAQTIFVFIGICLLAEAVLDLVTLLMVRRHLRRFEKAMEV